MHTTRKDNDTLGLNLQKHLLFITANLILSMLVGYGPSTEELKAVDYTPLIRDDWQVSAPEEQGLDPMLVAELYYNAVKLLRTTLMKDQLIVEMKCNRPQRASPLHWLGLPWSKVVCQAWIRR
jgi:hypothetical protein